MIDPPAQLDSLAVMADWVELCALTGEPAEVSKSEIGEALADGGLVAGLTEDFFDDDDDWADDTPLGTADNNYLDDLWQVVEDRAAIPGNAYPFETDAEVLRVKGPSWRAFPAYTMLLLLDHGHEYAELGQFLEPSSDDARLFEKVCEASLGTLFNSRAQRFGWPREPDWPTSINERLTHFAELIGLGVESLEGKTQPTDNDRGLDVAVPIGFDDDLQSTAWVLFQCACGKNWKSKCGEPSIGDWRDVINWNGAQLLKGLAVSRRLVQPWDVKRTGRKFDALVVERTRLMRGEPDASLDTTTKDSVVGWCERVLDELPMVG